jgi:hypothetical protein
MTLLGEPAASGEEHEASAGHQAAESVKAALAGTTSPRWSRRRRRHRPLRLSFPQRALARFAAPCASSMYHRPTGMLCSDGAEVWASVM